MMVNAVYGGQIGTQTSFAYDWLGTYNISTTDRMWIDCGVQTHTEVGYHVEDASVTVTDKSTTDDVICEMRGITATGETRFTGAQKTTAGLPRGTSTFTWESVGTPGYQRLRGKSRIRDDYVARKPPSRAG